MAHEIKLGVQLDSSKAKSEFESLVKQLSNNKNLKLKIDFDSKNFNLSSITKQIDNLNNKLKNGLNLDGITKSAYSSAKEIESQYKTLGETIGKLHEKSDLKINTKNGLQEAKEVNKALKERYDMINKIEEKRLQSENKSRNNNIKNEEAQAKAINRALEERYKIEQKINSFKESGTSSLNKLKSNGFIDTSVISSLQNRLNNINTNNAEKEIKELQNTIKNLSSSESGIVRLQNQITKMESNLGNMKGKFGEGFINNKASEEIRQYESEINKLKSTMSSMKGGTSFSSSKITSDLNSASNASRNLNNALKQGGVHAESFGSKMKSALGNMGLWVTGYQAIQGTINALKDGVKTVTEVDTAMRDVRRVVDNVPKEELDKYPLQANKTAIELGKSTEDIIKMSATWAQLGQTWEDSSGTLTKWSTVLSNVADLSAEESVNDLVSTMKAFKLEAKDVPTIVDMINESGNKFALSSKDLAEGLRTSGAALAITGNDLYESSSLITAGTEVMRDPSQVANGLKTIAMNLQAVKQKKGDTFYKLKDDLKSMAEVDLTDTNGELRSTFDLIVDLSKNWDKLSEMQQSSLLQGIAGKQQANYSSYV